MESNIQAEKQTWSEKEILDTYNDEYWAKKYDVSTKEILDTEKIGISAKIIEASMKNKSFSM